MSFDLPVFDLNPLRKQFRFFLLCIVIIAVVCFLAGYFIETRSVLRSFYETGRNRWIFFGLILVFTYFTGFQQKRHLKKIVANEDLHQRVLLYPAYYKTKLILAACSFFLTGLIWILTGGKFIFFFFVIQFLISIVHVPNKVIITRELRSAEIEFI